MVQVVSIRKRIFDVLKHIVKVRKLFVPIAVLLTYWMCINEAIILPHFEAKINSYRLILTMVLPTKKPTFGSSSLGGF